VRRLACSVAWRLSFSVFPRVALPFPQFALLHSATCVQLRLITILGNCGCARLPFPWCAPAIIRQHSSNCGLELDNFIFQTHVNAVNVLGKYSAVQRRNKEQNPLFEL
jgi:hypothetical protein